LFNHESPLRGEEFVTRKVTLGLNKIALGLQDVLYMGNLNAKRDWGHARDFVEMQWLMLQQDTPQDFVISTGKQHSIRQFIELAASYLDMDIYWQGNHLDEVGIDKKTGKVIVAIDPQFFRPTEVDALVGCSKKAQKILGWSPKTTFEELVKEMVEFDKNLILKSENAYSVCS
jgi:GDPmannose 4,6-dehydratase